MGVGGACPKGFGFANGCDNVGVAAGGCDAPCAPVLENSASDIDGNDCL